MTSRERVLAALRREEPDRVPYCELWVDRPLAARLADWGGRDAEFTELESNPYTIDEVKTLAESLGMDNIFYVLRAPVFADTGVGADGRAFYGHGQITCEADLERMVLPDPHDDALYAEAAAFAEQKGDYAAWLVTRVGIFSTIISMGLEGFSIALHENRPLVEAVLDRYTDWSVAVAEHVSALGFDVYASTDDMAFKSAPFFSPQVFRDLVLPRYRRVGEVLGLPWIIHSDGNLRPFVDDLLTLGIAGLHPNEKGAMDIRAMKRDYGDRLCLLGNVDLNLLGLASPEEVDAEVRGLIRDIAPGGGYIVTSGNSLASYLKPENCRAMAQAVRKYGQYPISV